MGQHSKIEQTSTGDQNVVIGSVEAGAHVSVEIGVAPPSPQQSLPPQRSLRQLPGDIDRFRGREAEVKRILAQFQTNNATTAVALFAISGMAGVGKSKLAVHVAHQLKEQFSDAQLYYNLRGADELPVAPFDVLGQWLRSFGLDDANIPMRLEDRVIVYRSWLADKQALILLDNVRDETQVRPLLPGSGTCGVLVTSRRKLGALHGTQEIDLGIMPESEALDLLAAEIDEERFHKSFDAAKSIVINCGRLPLAISIAGGTLRNKSHWQLESYADKLLEEKQRLAKLKLSDLDVCASFTLSYKELSDSDSRLFRYLGLLLADFDVSLATLILGATKEVTEEALERLEDARLIECPLEGQYCFHDLIRIYSNQKLEDTENPLSIIEALDKVAKYYYHYEQRKSATECHAKGMSLAEKTNNFYWKAEALLGLCRVYTDCYGNEGQLDRALSFGEESLETFVLLNNQNGIAQSKLCIGIIYSHQRRMAEAEYFLKGSLEDFQSLGDLKGEGSALNSLGGVSLYLGKIEEAIALFEKSFEISSEHGDALGKAVKLGNLARSFKELGRIDVALTYGQRSLQAFRNETDLLGEGDLFDFTGDLYRENHDLERASYCYLESLRICRDIGKHDWIDWEPDLLMKLGDIYKDKGDLTKSAQYYEEGLDYCRSICGQDLQSFSNLDELSRALPGRTESVRTTGIEIIDKLASLYVQQNDWENALQLYTQALALKRQSGNRRDEIQAFNNLGYIYGIQRQWKKAANLHYQGLQISQELGDQLSEGKTLARLGMLYARKNQIYQAVNVWQEALIKLPPDSPAAKEIMHCLESPKSFSQRAELSQQQVIIRCSIWIGTAGFTIYVFAIGHQLVAFVAILLFVSFITFNLWRARRYYK